MICSVCLLSRSCSRTNAEEELPCKNVSAFWFSDTFLQGSSSSAEGGGAAIMERT